jgi:hypothetical protein
MEKLAFGARHSKGTSHLKAFEGNALTPAVFRDVCRRCFNIRFTAPELASILNLFDFDGTKTKIGCKAFMTKFATLSFQEKEKMWTIERERRTKSAKEQEEYQARIRSAAEKTAVDSIDLDFTEDDIKRADERFAEGAKKSIAKFSNVSITQDYQASVVTPDQLRGILLVSKKKSILL